MTPSQKQHPSTPISQTTPETPAAPQTPASSDAASEPAVCFVLAPTPAQLGRAPGQINRSSESQDSGSKSATELDDEVEEGKVELVADDVLLSPKKAGLKRVADEGMDK